MTLNLEIRSSSACRASLDEVSLFLLDQLTAMGIWSQVSGTAGWAAKKGKAAACSTGAAVSWIAAPALTKVNKNSRDIAVVTTGTVAANAAVVPALRWVHSCWACSGISRCWVDVHVRWGSISWCVLISRKLQAQARIDLQTLTGQLACVQNLGMHWHSLWLWAVPLWAL